MKTTRADIFRINKPYGIAIRISDLKYSWFNRKYIEQYSSSSDKHGIDALKFRDTLNDKAVIDKLKKLAEENSKYGTSFDNYKAGNEEYFRMWFYNDSSFPFNQNGEIDNRMDRYENILFKAEQIVGC
ncbi:hypothetical protein SAMN05216357_11087 [Porphyromonadaceae bacterium KH3CP3RA]|nr:hypothetical protein SAMN05216357_11087 [Porphyromonadaceae bacterium KH3CP3RA]